MGIFGTAAFGQDAPKKPTNPNKLKVKMVEKKSDARLQTAKEPKTVQAQKTRPGATSIESEKREVRSKKVVVKSVTKGAPVKKTAPEKEKQMEK